MVLLEKQNPANLAAKRTEFNDTFLNSLLLKFTNYLELAEIYYSSERSSAVFFVKDEVIPMLQTTNQFLQLVNMPIILSKTAQQKIDIRDYVVASMFRYCKQSLRLRDIRYRYKVQKLMKEISPLAT